MVLTPDPTPITATIIFIPILILTEFSVLLGRRMERGRSPK
jgi:Sec-independent protein secretion pathway component TatC